MTPILINLILLFLIKNPVYTVTFGVAVLPIGSQHQPPPPFFSSGVVIIVHYMVRTLNALFATYDLHDN